MKCENCGATLADEAKFCGECGTPVSETTEEVLEENIEEGTKKGKGLLLFLGGVILAIALGLLGGNLLFEYLNDDEDGEIVSEEEGEQGAAEDKKENTGDSADKKADDKADVKEEERDLEKEQEKKEEQENQDEEKTPAIQKVPAEEEVLRIREKYNDITANMSQGAYTETNLSQGVTGYYNGSELKSIVISKGVDGSAYSRFFYFDDDQLMFAYYEGSDAHRFYFYQGALMRWRYSKSTANSQDAVNHDWETTSQFYEWEDIVKKDANQYK